MHTISLLFVYCLAGCSYHPYIPSGDMINCDSPGTVGKNEYAVSGAGGFLGQVLDYSVLNGWLSVKYGVTERLDIGVRGYGIMYPDAEMTYSDYKPFSLGTMVHSKVALVPGVFAMTGGVGYGFSDLGNYLFLNYGLTLGYENRYVVPYVHLGSHYGIPIKPKEHDLSIIDNDEMGEHRYIPNETLGLLMNAGIKLPVGLWFRFLHGLSLHAVGGIAIASDGAAHDDFMKGGFGVEYQLPVNNGRNAGLNSR